MPVSGAKLASPLMGDPLATSYSPKLTNVKKADFTSSGYYVNAGGIVTFTAMVNAQGLCESKDSAGFGLTLPVPAKAGTRVVFALSYDGRDADRGTWTGEAIMYAGGDGTQADRLRTTGTANGAALSNITFMYGKSEGAVNAEILTVSGSYIAA